MKIITRIGTPFPGEHVAAVEPELSPEVANHWNVRLNLYTGRALSDTALKQEQQGRAGRLATRGQMVSAGIVSGLEVALERGEEVERPRYYYHVAAGMGLTASGEDVVVRQSLRINVLDVQVCGPPALFATPDGESGGSTGAVVDSDDGATHQVGGWTLGRLLKHRATHGIHEHPGPSLPRVGVLLLQPVEGEVIDRAATTDPCEEDSQNYAFEDQQIVDGSRLLWYVWPTAWRRLPKPDRLRRNQIAYTIFDAEQENSADALLPWEPFGVPLALVGFNRRWKPLFADRNAVARAGGKPRRRTSAIANAGNPFLWQARLEQFAEHVAEIAVPRPTTQEWDAAHFDMRAYAAPVLSRQFRFIPPAGILPRAVMNFTTRQQTFFPSTYRVDALPVPLEQLDLAIEGSAALAPFDAFVPDEVQILVPVPQLWFEPNLLREEIVSPEFNETIDALVRRRSKWLLRRETIRARQAAIDRAIGNVEQLYPDRDPNALDENEAIASDPIDSTLPALSKPEPTFGTSEEGSDLVATALTRLREYLVKDTPLYDDVARVSFDPSKLGLTPTAFSVWLASQAGLKGKVTYDSERRELVYTAKSDPMSEAEQTRLKALIPSTDAYVTAVDALFTKSQPQVPFVREAVSLGDRANTITERGVSELGDRVNTIFERGVGGVGFIGTIDARTLRFPFRPGMRRYAAGTLGNVSSRVHLASLPVSRSDLDEASSGKVWYDDMEEYLVYTPHPEPMTDAEREALLGPYAGNETYKNAVNALHARSHRNEVVLLDRLGLRRFIERMAKKIRAADDKVDLCFARLQTDIYRLRQFMLGSNAATRLATSPVLASIAKGESAFATQEKLHEFIAEAKGPLPNVKLPTEDELRAAPPTIPSEPPREVPSDAADRIIRGDVFATALLTARTPLAAPTALPSQTPKKEDVIAQPAIIGRALDFRTATIAERLDQPKAPEVKNSAVASKASLLAELTELGINLDDLEIPGFNAYDDGGKLIGYELLPPIPGDARVKRVIAKEVRHTFRDVEQRGLVRQVLQGYHDLDPLDGDESAFFAMAVRALDHAVAILRVVEGRIQAYNNALERCRQTLAELEGFRAQVDARLRVIESELTETRHDISVSRALLAEETARVERVKERRRRVIAEHVPYLAFRRPRSRDLLEDVPLRHLDPAAVEPAVPACLAHRVDVPRELRAMVKLFRDVPVRWLPYVSAVVDMLDRIELIIQTTQYAVMRASAKVQTSIAPAKAMAPGVSLGASIQRVVSTHEEIVSRARAQTAQLDLAGFCAQSWVRARDRAREILSLGDLVDADHGRPEIARAATHELEMISRVAGCLYARFGEVAPQIRLAWAQQLSQYDDPVNLRHLSSLPRWSAIDYLDRRELQGLADWLFERVDPDQPRALALVSDLVRLCILLASHAPVREIIAGRVHQPAAVQRGGRVDLAVDLSKVHVGMQVLLYADAVAGPEVVARAFVEDIGDGKAAARVVDTMLPTVTLGENARAQFLEPDHPDLTTLDSGTREPKLGAPMKSVSFAGTHAGHR